MPELPEVEVVRRGLERHVVGSRIAAVEVLHERPVRRHLLGASAFAAELVGRRFEAARRRGKYLWLPLDDGNALMAHLGTRCRNTCLVSADPNHTPFHQVTEADALQSEALRLIKM